MLSKQLSFATVICTVFCLTVAIVPIHGNSIAESSVDLVQSIDVLDQEASLPLFGGLSVERLTNTGAAPRTGSETLIERAERYLQTHEVQFNVPQSEEASGNIAGKFTEGFEHIFKK